MAFERMEATRFQKIQWDIISLFLWLGLLAGNLIAIVSGYKLVITILNSIRDWWHYKQPQVDAGGLIIIFVVSGFVAFFCNFRIDERSSAKYQRDWLAENNRIKEKAIEQSKKPLSIWAKLGLFYWFLIILGIFIAYFY